MVGDQGVVDAGSLRNGPRARTLKSLFRKLVQCGIKDSASCHDRACLLLPLALSLGCAWPAAPRPLPGTRARCRVLLHTNHSSNATATNTVAPEFAV